MVACFRKCVYGCQTQIQPIRCKYLVTSPFETKTKGIFGPNSELQTNNIQSGSLMLCQAMQVVTPGTTSSLIFKFQRNSNQTISVG